MKDKSKLYLLCWVFSYGSASSNRLLAYANSAAKKGIPVAIVALMRIDINGYIPQHGVVLRGLYPCIIANKMLAFITSLFSVMFFLIHTVKKEDRILQYGSSEYLPLCLLLRRKQLWFEVTECPDLFHPQNYPFSIYKKLWKKLRGIIVISSNLKQYFIDHGVKPENVTIVNMIVDPSRFDNLLEDKTRGKYIAYCGNVNKSCKDGIDDLLQAFVLYHQTYSDRKLYIIGPIVLDEQKEKFDNFLKLSRADDAVVFTGSVYPTDIPSLLRNAEMLVLARPNNIQAKYGFPTKVGEYLLSGRPTVLTDVGNITDFFTDGDNAYIAEPGNVESIAKKMIQISTDEEESTSVGKRGKKTALRFFDSDKEMEKILTLMRN